MSTTPINPPAAPAVKKKNWFINLADNVGHVIEDVYKFAPHVASKVLFVIQAEEELTPEFVSALKLFLTDSVALVATGTEAVATRGTNPTLDVATFGALETLVKDFNTFYPILVAAIDALEGKTTATPPATAAQLKTEQAAAGTAPPSLTPPTPTDKVMPIITPKDAVK
jgi:hypothetical protein